MLSERLELRITTAEREAYEAAASKARVSVSEWIRERLSKATARSSKGS